MYDIRKKIDFLRKELHNHNHRYYIEDSPVLTDLEFDKMLKEFIVSNKNFIADTGWTPPYHYREGIKKTCLWYKRTFTIK